MAVNYGQVAIVPKGEWSAETQYKVNNLVSYDGSSYVAKVQPPVGTLPTNTSYWQVSAAGTKKATEDSLGTVMPDGTTTTVNEDGKLSVNTARQDALGVVMGSDDITVGEDGKLSVNTAFEQATELANIIAGEAIKSVLGKVSKAIATTMSLDENALLKNMISGIDVNDSNKVPSSAYIHTLVERIGMGTELASGLDDLTTGLNTVNNNLSNRLIGQNANWFPNGTSLSSVLSGNVGVSTYGIKPDNAPSETISGGFGYGTLFAVCGRGDEGYGYGYAIYSGSNATGSRVFATYDRDSGWSERVSKSDLVPIQKGSTFAEDIGTLSSPSQLKHAGFYKFQTMTADVNADAGTETMTEYATGDFYGLLLGSNINTTGGCDFGTLILTSPRVNNGIWICTIWQKKFIHWYKVGKS